MSIRSLIAIENSDKTIEAIYCHWGGAPENNGRILLEHFKKPEKLRELIALGSLSELHPRLQPVGEHRFNKREPGTTVAHHRDRGDDWSDVQPRKFCSLNEFLGQKFGYFDADFLYVLTNKGLWTVYPRRINKPVGRKLNLATVLKKEKP
jgi:hypothetical protein